jgi:hypothetical protein
VGVHHEQNQSRLDGAEGYPPFFAAATDVRLSYSVRIVEHHGGCLKRNTMLAAIVAVLTLIPFKAHSLAFA